VRASPVPNSPRRWLVPLAFGLLGTLGIAAHAQETLPTKVPAGTKLVVADQNEELQTLMIASGEHAKLASSATYANFIGGPAILEAFRAGALDLATVGNVPPIQAQAAGDTVLIVAARQTSEPDYHFALRPGLTLNALQDFRGKRIAYAEGTGRQAFVLLALKLGGLTRKDVTFVPLRSSDMPDAVRSGRAFHCSYSMNSTLRRYDVRCGGETCTREQAFHCVSILRSGARHRRLA
jgi:sulfonate transport system substrate-binding protein